MKEHSGGTPEKRPLLKVLTAIHVASYMIPPVALVWVSCDKTGLIFGMLIAFCMGGMFEIWMRRRDRRR